MPKKYVINQDGKEYEFTSGIGGGIVVRKKPEPNMAQQIKPMAPVAKSVSPKMAEEFVRKRRRSGISKAISAAPRG